MTLTERAQAILNGESAFAIKVEKLKSDMAWLMDNVGEVVQLTGYRLDDQVLTHALVSAGVSVVPLVRTKHSTASRASIAEITNDRYDLKKTETSRTTSVSAETFLGGWSKSELVQYVLDHEVPVDPLDMPGFTQSAA